MREFRSELPGQNPAKDELDSLPEDIRQKITTGSPDEAAKAVDALNDLLDSQGKQLSEEARRLLNLERAIADGRAYK